MKRTSAFPVHLRMKLLRVVVEFMGRSGVSESAIRNAFEGGLAEAKKRKGEYCRHDGKYVGNGSVSAELLRLWHRDGRYIDRDARPKPLLLLKGKNNLSAAIRKLDPEADPVQILREMKMMGLIRRASGGRYLPTSESLTMSQLHPLAVEHVAKSVIRLVSTVCRNTDPSGKALSLVERYAYVPDLNRSDIKAFAEFTRRRGIACLEAVDDWLERRRVTRVGALGRKKKEGVPAGVHLVAYLGDTSERRASEDRSISRRQPKGKGPVEAPRALGRSISARGAPA